MNGERTNLETYTWGSCPLTRTADTDPRRADRDRTKLSAHRARVVIDEIGRCPRERTVSGQGLSAHQTVSGQ
jgi:hypothetical protein